MGSARRVPGVWAASRHGGVRTKPCSRRCPAGSRAARGLRRAGEGW